VHWPATPLAGRPLAIVVLFQARQPSTPDDVQLVDRLLERTGALVLAVTAAHAIEAHATLAWAADHAGELGADPDRLAVVGVGSGAALAERVVELATDEGWPPLRHVALIWPHDDPGAALDRLAAALTPAAPRATR
jgi:acetyl esterase/lipase